jgi:hypothetical protein
MIFYPKCSEATDERAPSPDPTTAFVEDLDAWITRHRTIQGRELLAELPFEPGDEGLRIQRQTEGIVVVGTALLEILRHVLCW